MVRGNTLALFYAGTLVNKGLISSVFNQVKNKPEVIGSDRPLGALVLRQASAFAGTPDDAHSMVIIEGGEFGVDEATAQRIIGAYSAAGIRAEKADDNFDNMFGKMAERLDMANGGIPNDPPRSLTDNVTAHPNSPAAHVETDGRNEPKRMETGTGTALDLEGAANGLANTDGLGNPNIPGRGASEDPKEGPTTEQVAQQAAARAEGEAAQASGDDEAKAEADKNAKAAADAAEKREQATMDQQKSEQDQKADAQAQTGDQKAEAATTAKPATTAKKK